MLYLTENPNAVDLRTPIYASVSFSVSLFCCRVHGRHWKLMPRKPKTLWNWKLALENSTQVWKDDLKNMMFDAKHRFGDVSWEVMEDGSGMQYCEVWGHKGTRLATTFSPTVHSWLTSTLHV